MQDGEDLLCIMALQTAKSTAIKHDKFNAKRAKISGDNHHYNCMDYLQSLEEKDAFLTLF